MTNFKLTQEAIGRILDGDVDFIKRQKRMRKNEAVVLSDAIFISKSGLTFRYNGKDILNIEFPVVDFNNGETITVELKSAETRIRIF